MGEAGRADGAGQRCSNDHEVALRVYHPMCLAIISEPNFFLVENHVEEIARCPI